MSLREHPRQPQITREDLPADLTPETLRQVDFRILRAVSQHDNGILSPAEQEQFDAALREVVRGTSSFVNDSLERSRRGGPANLDPDMRRSYARIQQRLAHQAQRAQQRLPELGIDVSPELGAASEPATTAPASTAGEVDDDVSPSSLELEVEQTSETLDMLERIAALQQQQVEHQARQFLTETRSLFFAFLVSVAVIVAGVAPLVEAEPHERLQILLWTLVAVTVAGLVYVVVRGRQSKK
jgi:hypothetical protein